MIKRLYISIHNAKNFSDIQSMLGSLKKDCKKRRIFSHLSILAPTGITK